MIAEFMRNQAMRAEKAMEKRKQSFISKLEGQREARTEISVRKLQIERIRGEIQGFKSVAALSSNSRMRSKP
jgi:hypothetical protein